MVTVVLTVFSIASESMHHSITMSIRYGLICNESVWIRVISRDQSGSIAVYCLRRKFPAVHSWYGEALKAKWRRPQDIKDQFASTSICGNNQHSAASRGSSRPTRERRRRMNAMFW